MDCSDEEVAAFLASDNFPVLKNERILIAAKGETPDTIPVWIMRQAGRYLPEFLEFRQKHSFFEICQNPKLACEVTLQPIRRFNLDASIIFSDILVLPQALGMEVIMMKERGPVFPNPLTLDTVKSLQWDGAIDKLQYVGKAIRLTRHKLEGKVPLLGFSAAPWTLMVYMIEGGGTKTASKAKKWLYAHPTVAENLLNKLSDLIIDYLVMQIKYGAQMIQIFESSAEYLNVDLYQKFMQPLLIKIREGVLEKLIVQGLNSVPMIFFAKGGYHLLEIQAQLGFEVISLDWTADPKHVRSLAQGKFALQGNLDPCALYSSPEDLKAYVEKMVQAFGPKGYIVNLGHGIYPDAPVEAVKCFVDTVHGFK